MTINLTCPCGEVISAEGEDTLVDRVQTHARDHDGAPQLSREHILAHVHGEHPDED
jgi:hypothetical protein